LKSLYSWWNSDEAIQNGSPDDGSGRRTQCLRRVLVINGADTNPDRDANTGCYRDADTYTGTGSRG
jgi:hypothetical protein